MTETESGPEARLRRLEDLEEIRQLFVDYGLLLDLGDYAAYAHLFAEDGELMLGPMGRAKGRQEIEAMMVRIGSPDASHHLITSPKVTLDGDRAASRVMWTVINRAEDGNPVVRMVGHHEDDLVREGGRWRFQRRRGFVEIPTAVRR
jgi:uncharacterized protein (TIGR02246 family)